MIMSGYGKEVYITENDDVSYVKINGKEYELETRDYYDEETGDKSYHFIVKDTKGKEVYNYYENLDLSNDEKSCSQNIFVVDDDFLKEGALSFLLAKLKNTDYGLIHLKVFPKRDEEIQIYQTIEEYLSDISYWITFISSNIITTKFVDKINYKKYIGTHFIQIPFYIAAAKESQKNLMINRRIFEDAADGATNGGYNFFEVFVVNYLTIRREMLADTKNEVFYYKKEKKRFFNEFLLDFINKIYFKKDKGRFKTEGGWRILFQYFGGNIYFYKGILKLLLKRILRR